MLKFLYNLFSVQFLRNATRSPQDASKVFRFVSIVFIVIGALLTYNIFSDGDLPVRNSMIFYVIMPIFVIASILFYANTILKKVDIERYEKPDLQFFKIMLNGFVGLGIFFYVFTFLNVLFTFFLLVSIALFCSLYIFTLGTVTVYLTFGFFLGIPYVFFELEGYIFSFFGTDAVGFGFLVGGVVVILPLLLSLYVIFNQNSLLKKD